MLVLNQVHENPVLQLISLLLLIYPLKSLLNPFKTLYATSNLQDIGCITQHKLEVL